MENASKALLIAAEVLIGLILLTLIAYGHNQISNYYATREQNKEIEQMIDFNKEYIPYNRDDVRGTDIISLVNKILDFNTLEEDPITIDITISTSNKANEFYYKMEKPNDADKVLIDINRVYASHPSSGQRDIQTMFNSAIDLEKDYTQGRATKLAANMSTLMGENSRKDPLELLKELKINNATEADLPGIRNDILKYYQYNQFKRAHFNCTNLEYTDEGRVNSFSFEFNGKFE